VLAAGQVFSRPEERAVQSRTVTLALRPGDVDILVAARARGALSLSLRGVNDHELIAPRKPQPQTDPEAEKRWKLAEEARHKAEHDLRLLQEELARKPAEIKAPAAPPAPRIATIYRGIHNIERVRLDFPGQSELPASQWSVIPETGAVGLQRGFGKGSLGSLDDDTQP
jgi:pilus assembly protein CpaB